jgi:hypothetical protein
MLGGPIRFQVPTATTPVDAAAASVTRLQYGHSLTLAGEFTGGH